MGSGIYGIGVSALKVAQAGISVTTHNIANANTPGYSRQEILQAAALPQNTGAGFFGQGADVVAVKRIYSEFLGAQLTEAQTRSSNLSTQFDLATQISNLLGDANGGLSTSLQDFFGAANSVADAPESIAARQTLLGSGQSLSNRLQTLDARLTEIRDGLNGQIGNSVTLINSYAKQIAVLNDTIVQAQAQSGQRQAPNDLLDQRDQLINQLSQEIRVTSIKQPDGSMDVFIGSGQSLVIGTQTSALQAAASPTDQTALEVVYVNNKGVIRIQQSALQGGHLGGFLAFRDGVLDPAQNALGRIAIGIADTFNQQHQQGIDLNGTLGGTFFNAGSPQVAAASGNVGNATLNAVISDSGALTGYDYDLRFDGANYTLFNTSTNAAVQSFTPAQLATPQGVNGTGLTLQLAAGSVADVAGDSYRIRPTATGARDFTLAVADPARIAAANPVRGNAALANLGNATIAQPVVSGGLPLDANLQQPITLTFDNPPTTYTVSGTGAPVGAQPYTDGATFTINGWSTRISGTPVAGDTFTVSANSNASTDGGNMLKLAQLQTANTLANGTTSYQGAYGQLIAQVGSQTRELDVTSQAQASMLAQITRAQQSESGVNLDEEAANLLKFQQAYQAAAKAMAISQAMFDSLLQLGG
ncbi:flagellar hook-associated protein FlgK [Ferrigenium sp. UT5]|uniref:flagellar hook-associated protein FlgK n=1 Tax=Ferrigenium sp. UT5 TaxID=3242105 RepID=UPI00354B6C8D